LKRFRVGNNEQVVFEKLDPYSAVVEGDEINNISNRSNSNETTDAYVRSTDISII